MLFLDGTVGNLGYIFSVSTYHGAFSMQVDGHPRKRDMPKRTWMELVRLDLKKCNLLEELTIDRLEWRRGIYVADPIQLGQD